MNPTYEDVLMAYKQQVIVLTESLVLAMAEKSALQRALNEAMDTLTQIYEDAAEKAAED